MEHVLANTLAALMEAPEGKPMTFLAIPKMLTDPKFRTGVLSHVSDPIVRDFWLVEFAGYDPRLRAEIISPVLNKVGAFMRNPIKPVSELRPDERTKLSDLVLLCSNCHRKIHRKRPWLSVAELKDLFAR